MASVPPKDVEPIDGVLRIVSNRCRNLKKAIERATALEKAMESGKIVNAEQLESVRAKSVRISLLQELEEILRKQSVLVTPPKLSKRAAKRLQKEKYCCSSENGSDLASESEKKKHSTGTEGMAQMDSPGVSSSTDGNAIDSLEKQEKNGLENGKQKRDPDAEAQLVTIDALRSQEIEREHARQLRSATQSTMASILEIAHVVTFVNQQGGRDCIARYFASPHHALDTRKVSDMDIEVLLYFYRMLTSPNGCVPHQQAVQTSVAHCSAYLEGSTAEAFTGTSYKTLRDIVNSIAACPLLTKRSPDGLSHGGRAVNPNSVVREANWLGQFNTAEPARTGGRVVNPSSMVHEATVMRPQF